MKEKLFEIAKTARLGQREVIEFTDGLKNGDGPVLLHREAFQEVLRQVEKAYSDQVGNGVCPVPLGYYYSPSRPSPLLRAISERNDTFGGMALRDTPIVHSMVSSNGLDQLKLYAQANSPLLADCADVLGRARDYAFSATNGGVSSSPWSFMVSYEISPDLPRRSGEHIGFQMRVEDPDFGEVLFGRKARSAFNTLRGFSFNNLDHCRGTGWIAKRLGIEL